MNAKQTKIIAGIVVVLIVLLLGIMVIYQMNIAPASTAVEVVDSPTVQITNTFSDLRINELPATWTPLPETTRATLEMVTEQQAATITVQSLIATARPPVQLSGTGSGDTELFSMPVSHMKFTWEYSGKPGEPGNVRYAQERHFASLEALKNTYNIDLERLRKEEEAAEERGDTAALEEVRDSIFALEKEYYEKVANENERYKKELDGYLTTFAIKVGRADNPDRKTFVSMTGIYSG
jgi:hypothetical protein